MTQPDIRIVTLTVDGIRGSRQQRDGTSQLSVYADIPAMGSKFPTGPLWVAEATQPIVGAEYTVRLRKGNLKDGRAGGENWDYWWEVDEWDVQDAPDPVQQRPQMTSFAPDSPVQPKQGSPAQAAPQRAPVADATRMSIERQVAAKEATQLLLPTFHTLDAADAPIDAEEYGAALNAWSSWADHIYAWISGDVPKPAPAPSADAAGFDDLPSASEEPAVLAERPFANTGQLLNEAQAKWGKNKFEVYTVLGLTQIDKPIEGDLEVAWQQLEEEWN
jgi:hypothetical protein